MHRIARRKGTRPDCPSAEELAAYIDFGLDGRVADYLEGCRSCLWVYTESIHFLTSVIALRLWKEAGLSTRTANALARDGILTWEDLQARARADFETIPGIGTKGAAAIRRLIESGAGETGN